MGITGCSFRKRILSVCIDIAFHGKAGCRSSLPFAFPALYFLIATCTVIVYNYFVALPITFTGSEHHSSCIFQHRDEVRNYKRLGEHVFGGTIQTWTLPTPFTFLVDVILAMTLPESNVPSFQPFLSRIRATDVFRPGIAFVFTLPTERIVLFLTQGIWNQLFDRFPVGINGDVVIVYRAR